ncbi:MAG: hypothetical protein CL823_00390 [Crocinitomicaceae bacterium]|nr:hypothetical protein [Crocinitomicaceae bacterium]
MKKALKYISIGVVIILLAYLSIGLLHPSIEYTNSVVIDATVEEVFDVFTDESLASEWMIGYKGYEILEGAPHAPGSKFLMKFEHVIFRDTTYDVDSLVSKEIILSLENPKRDTVIFQDTLMLLQKTECLVDNVQPFEFIETLTVFKENEEFSFDMVTDMYTGSVKVEFAGSNPCTVTATTSNTGSNIFYKSLFYLSESIFVEQSQLNYDLLKDLIEKRAKK